MTDYINIAFYIFAGIFVVCGALIGLARDLSKTLVRLASIIVSAIFALGLTLLLFLSIRSFVTFESVGSFIAQSVDPDAAGTLMPIFTALFSVLICILGTVIALFIFVPAFFLFRLLGMIPYFIIKKHLPKTNFACHRLVSMLVGALCGFLITVIMIIPAFSLVDYSNRILTSLTEGIETNEEIGDGTEDLIEFNNDYLTPINDSIPAKITVACGAREFFSLVTTYKYNNEKICLSDEGLKLSEAIGEILPKISSLDTEDGKKALRDAVGKIKEIASSDYSLNMIKDALNGFCDYYKENPSSFDFDDETAKQFFDNISDAFANSNTDTVKEDIQTLYDTVNYLIDKDAFKILKEVFNNESDEVDYEKLFSNKELINGIINILNKNQRYKKIVSEISKMIVQKIAEEIEIPEIGDNEFSDMISDVFDVLANNDSTKEEKEKTVQNLITQKLEEESIDIPDEITKKVSESIVKEFDGKEEITTDDIQKFIAKEAFENINLQDIINSL